MAVKFPLKMSDGTQVKTIEELREHFDFKAVLGCYSNGRLLKWLEDRYYDEEAGEVRALDSASENFKKNLCEILGVTYSEEVDEGLDLGVVVKDNERRERLKEHTIDDRILAAVDSVAFTQSELDDLLKRLNTLEADNDGNKVIYLCGEHFTIPDDVDGIIYKGINEPTADVSDNFLERRIVFDGVKLNGVNDVIWRAERSTDSAEAFKLWSMAAEQGNAEAQYRLGICYYNGEGVETDYVEAMKWFREAAKKNHTKAFRHNGHYYNDFQKCIATNPIVALKKDGTVVENLETATQNWKNIIAIFGAGGIIVGLKSDGTVVTDCSSCIFVTQGGTQDWQNIVNIAVEEDGLIAGVRSDGSVVTNKEIDWYFNVPYWSDITAVSIGREHIVGLKKDGTVVAAGVNRYRECDVQDWHDIVAVAAGDCHTVGLKKDGTVNVVGPRDGTDEGDDENDFNVRSISKDAVEEVQNWCDIIAISLNGCKIVGLKKDGTVVAVDMKGSYEYAKDDLQDWHDIVAVARGSRCIVGLKKDGTICVTSNDFSPHKQYLNWNNIGLVLNESAFAKNDFAGEQVTSIVRALGGVDNIYIYDLGCLEEGKIKFYVWNRNGVDISMLKKAGIENINVEAKMTVVHTFAQPSLKESLLRMTGKTPFDKREEDRGNGIVYMQLSDINYNLENEFKAILPPNKLGNV